ncbi:MAG: ATP-binding cassette domain-containing protein [Persicimonas sp.]
MNVQLESVAKTFGRTRALSGVDLTIDAGERVALIGPNGSGKTTLIRIIMGMLRAQGTVTVGRWSPFDERPKLAEQVAYIPQIAPQMNVPLGRLIASISAVRGFEPARVEAVAERLDFRPSEHAGKSFRELSGGMKQKLLIALALAARPRLLIMDEPSASLDAEARSNFFELCADLPEETTILLCSHRIEEVRHLIARIVALEEGRVISDGPVERVVSELGRASIEVRVDPDLPDSTAAELHNWLDERGFRQLAGGRFVVFLPSSEKFSTVEALLSKWGDQLEDLVVNDLSKLQVEPTDTAPTTAKTNEERA